MKFTNTKEGYIYKYENLKMKLYKCKANIYFNKNVLQNIQLLKMIQLSSNCNYSIKSCVRLYNYTYYIHKCTYSTRLQANGQIFLADFN